MKAKVNHELFDFCLPHIARAQWLKELHGNRDAAHEHFPAAPSWAEAAVAAGLEADLASACKQRQLLTGRFTKGPGKERFTFWGHDYMWTKLGKPKAQKVGF